MQMKTHRKLISAVMTRNVVHVGVNQGASEALALMHAQRVSSVLVLDDELVLGIITERDIVRALRQQSNLDVLTCADLMQSPVVTVGAETPYVDAYHLMASRGIRHLAVTGEDGRMLGIASEGDVMRNFGVEYYMNFKDVASVMNTEFCRLSRNDTVRQALDEMVERKQSCVVVIDSEQRPVGLLTERDVVRLCSEHIDPPAVLMKQVMHSPVVTVLPRKRLHSAVRLMEQARIRRLVVVDEDGRACGLLTHHDVARGLEGDYASHLKEIVELQARHLREAAQAIDEKLLFANILRSVRGTAVLASDLEYRISYATPSVQEVLGLTLEEVGGADVRETLRRVGWDGAAAALQESAVSEGARHYVASTSTGKVDFQVSVLVDAQNNARGYLVLSQRI